MTTRTLAVVSAGLSHPSATRLLADQLAGAVRNELRNRGVQVEIRPVDLRGHAHDVVNNLLAGFPSAKLRAAAESATGSDGLIAVTPILNASYSGLFKSFFDVLEHGSLIDKPVLIGATGGTARHSLALEHALQPMFTTLRATVVPTSVFATSEDWANGRAKGALRARISRAAAGLADQMERRPAPAADPFALTTSFEELLAGD